MINHFKRNKPIVLVVLDGWGEAPPNRGNAIALAKTPVFDTLKENYPFTILQASEENVGLFKGQVGNSEAGHLNLGAGRIVKDDGMIISKSIQDKTFFKNQAILGAINHIKKNQSKLHLMGLITEEPTAHSHPKHILALLDLAEKEKVKNVFLHLFTDGRDSSQHAAIKAVRKLEKKIKQATIATLVGRFYAMDRKKNWSRTEKVYNLLVLGEGDFRSSIEETIVEAYNRGETDEFIKPTVITQPNKPLALIDDNDAVIFFNCRSDRSRQLAKTFVQKDFTQKNPGSFKRKKILKNLFFIALTDFGPDLDDIKTAYQAKRIENSLPFVLKNFSQLYLAEKEKYAHITYFFNGGRADPIVGEERISVDSPEVEHYDLIPEMSARKLTQIVLEKIKNYQKDFIAVNFANLDMLGHTGNLAAASQGAEVIDECLGEIISLVERRNGLAVITADHGNADEMINLKTNEILVSHSLNPVPLILFSRKYQNLKLRQGVLADVAPTILDLLKIKKPKEMTGSSLISKFKMQNAK